MPYTPPLNESDWIYSFSPWSTDTSPTTTCDPSLRYKGNSGRVFCAKPDANGNPSLPIGYWEDVYAITAGALPTPAQEVGLEAYLNAGQGAPIALPDMLAAFAAVGFNWQGPPPPYVPLVYAPAPPLTPPIPGAPVVAPVYTPAGSVWPPGFTPPAAPGAPAAAGAPAPVTTAAPAPAPDVYQSGGLKPMFLVGGGSGGDVGSVLGTIGSTALDYIPVIGPILGALFGSLFGGTDLSGLEHAVQNLAQQIATLGDTITRFAWKIANGLGALIEAMAEVWDNFFDAVWTYLKQLWKLLWCVVETIIPALIKALRDLRKLLDWIYQNILVKLLRYQQKIRLVLEILKALHFPLASKLDSVLGKIESALFRPMYYVLRMLNGHGLWTNFILAWDLTIQRPLFLRTMQKYQGDWIGMWWNAQAGLLPPGGGLPAAPAAPAASNASEIAAVEQYAQTGTGPYADIATQAHLILADINTPI